MASIQTTNEHANQTVQIAQYQSGQKSGRSDTKAAWHCENNWQSRKTGYENDRLS